MLGRSSQLGDDPGLTSRLGRVPKGLGCISLRLGLSHESLLDDAQWALIEPLLPPQRSGRGRPMRDHRQVVEGVIYRYRCGLAWRDLPGSFGPWKTVWKRHRRFSGDGTWDKIFAALLARADAAQEIDWTVSVDSTVNRAHQHATNLPRGTRTAAESVSVVPGGSTGTATATDPVVGVLADITGGRTELHRCAGSA